MDVQPIDTLIIGGGLSGIYAASLLAPRKKSLVLLEARSRLGGRILSPEHQGFFVDLGPSWYWPMINPKLTELIGNLGLTRYPQFETGLGRFQTKDRQIETIAGQPMYPPGWRLEGGMISLIQGLCATIPAETIRLNHPVCEIRRTDKGILVVVGADEKEPDAQFLAAEVILALPPRLAARSILFTPDLSFALAQSMLRASTWMAGQAKFFAVYDHAPWRQTGFSGQGFSVCGPLAEIHDGSGRENRPCGLTGFLGIPALRRTNREQLIGAVLAQLAEIYGPAAGQPHHFYFQDWAKEAFTSTEYDLRSAHNHPEFYPPSGKTSVWNGRLHLAGSETADHLGGYLEGALISGERAASAVH